MTVAAASLRAIAVLRVAWLVFWLLAARDTKSERWREPIASRAFYMVLLVARARLLAEPVILPPSLRTRVLPVDVAASIVGAVLVAAGLGPAIWARLHLGRNWSGLVTLKEDHALIRSRRVRYPIYSGLLPALLGTAVAIDDWRGVLAILCALAGFVVKLRVEEALMRRTFPDYDAYRRGTAALIPFVY